MMIETPRTMPTVAAQGFVPRDSVYRRAASSCALDAILSQLAFYSEPPPQSDYADFSRNNQPGSNVPRPPSPPFWRRLFCTASVEDQELYFDALEIIDDRKDDDEYLIAKSKLDSILILRGGDHKRGNFHHDHRNFASLGHYGNDEPSDDSFRSLPPGPMPYLHEYCEARLVDPMSNSHDNAGCVNGQGYDGYNQRHPQQPGRSQQQPYDDGYSRLAPPLPPKELPLRFLRAGKNDPIEGQRRYEATLQWRKENGMDTILMEAHPNFDLIKSVSI